MITEVSQLPNKETIERVCRQMSIDGWVFVHVYDDEYGYTSYADLEWDQVSRSWIAIDRETGEYWKGDGCYRNLADIKLA